MSHGHEPSKPGRPARDYADKDIHLRPIIKFFLGTALFTAAVFWGAKELLVKWEQHLGNQTETVSPFAAERIIPQTPRLLADEKRTLEQQRAIEQQELTTYGWVDQGKGVVHIPVDRAMDLTLERGLPARESK